MRTLFLMTTLCTLLVVGQLALKRAVVSLESDFSMMRILGLIGHPALWLAVLCMGLGTAVWAYVLSYESLARVYPMVALSYVFMALVLHFIYGEPYSWSQILGTGLIVLGVVALFR